MVSFWGADSCFNNEPIQMIDIKFITSASS